MQYAVCAMHSEPCVTCHARCSVWDPSCNHDTAPHTLRHAPRIVCHPTAPPRSPPPQITAVAAAAAAPTKQAIARTCWALGVTTRGGRGVREHGMPSGRAGMHNLVPPKCEVIRAGRAAYCTKGRLTWETLDAFHTMSLSSVVYVYHSLAG